MMTTASIPLKELSDITECPICREALTDPRVLPCIHTYCLQCLQDLCRDKEPGDDVACPLCRKQFIIPTNGVSGLPKNFFVMQLLNLRQLSSTERKQSPCEACLNEQDGKETDDVKSAKVYCVECHEKLCEDCDRSHRKLKATRGHKIVALGEEIKAEEFYSRFSTTSCDIHSAESLKLYCFDCKLVICMMCYVEQHNSHKCSDIGKVAEEFMQKIRGNAGRLVEGMEKCRGRVGELQKERCNLAEQTDKVEKEICNKAEQLKEMIERHKQELLSDLSSLEDERLMEIDSVCSEIEQHVVTMQGLKKYIDEVVKKGTVCDIVRTASSLQNRTDELLTTDFCETKICQLYNFNVSFTSSSTIIDDAKKSLGKVTITAKPYPNTVADARHLAMLTIFGDNEVLAVTSLDNELFISCADSKYIEVYDTETISLQRHLEIPGLPFGWSMCGLAACGTNNCLYVSQSNSLIDIPCSKVRKVSLSDSNVVTTWTVAAEPRGLSVTSPSNNILVACYTANVLQEYTTHGSLVREIRLRDFSPWHAVELSKDQFVVSNNCLASVDDLYIIDVDRQVMLHSYSLSGELVGPLVDPGGIVVTKTGSILVADSGNNRILRMDRTLSNAQQLDLPVNGGLQQPIGLWLDQSRDRLYVAEAEGKRLLVFDNVTVV